MAFEPRRVGRPSKATKTVFSASMDKMILRELRLYAALTRKSYSSIIEESVKGYLNDERRNEMKQVMDEMTLILRENGKEL